MGHHIPSHVFSSCFLLFREVFFTRKDFGISQWRPWRILLESNHTAAHQQFLVTLRRRIPPCFRWRDHRISLISIHVFSHLLKQHHRQGVNKLLSEHAPTLKPSGNLDMLLLIVPVFFVLLLSHWKTQTMDLCSKPNRKSGLERNLFMFHSSMFWGMEARQPGPIEWVNNYVT